MPIYEYVCSDCGEPVEQLQKLSDPPLVDCPVCGHAALRRKVSAASFRLSGGGWYETDFKSDGQRHLAGNDKESGSKSSDTSKTTKEAGSKNKSSDKAKSSESSKAAAAKKSESSRSASAQKATAKSSE